MKHHLEGGYFVTVCKRNGSDQIFVVFRKYIRDSSRHIPTNTAVAVKLEYFARFFYMLRVYMENMRCFENNIAGFGDFKIRIIQENGVMYMVLRRYIEREGRWLPRTPRINLTLSGVRKLWDLYDTLRDEIDFLGGYSTFLANMRRTVCFRCELYHRVLYGLTTPLRHEIV